MRLDKDYLKGELPIELTFAAEGHGPGTVIYILAGSAIPFSEAFCILLLLTD